MSDTGWRSYVSLPGAASLGLGLLLNVVANSSAEASRAIAAARSLSSLAELRQLEQLLPLIVAVQGKAESRAPIACELSNDTAVLHEVTEEQVYMKPATASGRPLKEKVTIRSESSEAEWFVEDGSGERVRVAGGASASHVHSCYATKQTYTPDKGNSLVGILWDKLLRNALLLGHLKTETYLPVGTLVTVVGEVARAATPWDRSNASTNAMGAVSTSAAGAASSAGAVSARSSYGINYVIRRPLAGGPFYIDAVHKEELVEALSRASRSYRWFAYGFGAVGVALMARKAIARLMQRRREAAIRKRQLEAAARQIEAAAAAAPRAGAAAAADSSAGGTAGAGYAGGDRPADLCVICFERQVQLVYTPCGHLCCCATCGSGLNKCPICRARSTPVLVYRP